MDLVATFGTTSVYCFHRISGRCKYGVVNGSLTQRGLKQGVGDKMVL